jgi:hypothetical protein
MKSLFPKRLVTEVTMYPHGHIFQSLTFYRQLWEASLQHSPKADNDDDEPRHTEG